MPVNRIRNILCVLASILATSAPAAAEEANEAIARCARIATVGDRILCLETALRHTSDADNLVAQREAATLPEVDDKVLLAVPDTAPADPAPAPVADTPDVIPETAPTAAATSVIAAAALVPTTASQQPDLGAEQLGRRDGSVDDEPDRIDANIIDYEMVLSGRLRLTLDNGQVWQQTTDDDRNTARFLRGEDNIPVEMWRGRSGGYRMYLVPFDRTLRVRRIR